MCAGLDRIDSSLLTSNVMTRRIKPQSWSDCKAEWRVVRSFNLRTPEMHPNEDIKNPIKNRERLRFLPGFFVVSLGGAIIRNLQLHIRSHPAEDL
jgi:hypothetical protein